MANNSEIYWDSEQGYDSEREIDLSREFDLNAGGEALITLLFGLPISAPPYWRGAKDGSSNLAGRDKSPYITKEITDHVVVKEIPTITSTEVDHGITSKEV